MNVATEGGGLYNVRKSFIKIVVILDSIVEISMGDDFNNMASFELPKFPYLAKN